MDKPWLCKEQVLSYNGMYVGFIVNQQLGEGIAGILNQVEDLMKSGRVDVFLAQKEADIADIIDSGSWHVAVYHLMSELSKKMD